MPEGEPIEKSEETPDQKAMSDQLKQMTENLDRNEPQQESGTVPEYLQMYEISGQDKITGHSFDRYTKDKEGEQTIKDASENPVSSYMEDFMKKIDSVPENDRASFMEKTLAGDDVEAQKACAWAIEAVPIETRIPLIEQCFANDNADVQRASAWAIGAVPKDKMVPLIEQGFKNKNVEVQKACAWQIEFAPEAQRVSLVEQGFATYDTDVQLACVQMIQHVPENDRGLLKEKVGSLIEQGLESDDVEKQKASGWMIEYAPEDKSDSFKKKMTSLIEQGLENGDVNVQKTYADMIAYAPEDKKHELFQMAREKLGDRLVEPPLYKNENITDQNFSRNEFAKTGSKTILLGGELKGKTIIRELKPKAFLVWQKLYENHDLWKNEGFEYVPIEPIQSFKLDKEGMVDVYSGVLDLSLGDWERMGGNFKVELERDKENILKSLEKNDIKHGHPHDKNFCLRFFRDESGKVDFNKKPRIYLIDFDEAVSP